MNTNLSTQSEQTIDGRPSALAPRGAGSRWAPRLSLRRRAVSRSPARVTQTPRQCRRHTKRRQSSAACRLAQMGPGSNVALSDAALASWHQMWTDARC